MITSFFVFAGPSVFAGLIVFLLSAGFLLLIILDMTKFFYIKKLVTSTNDIIIIKILKDTI